MKTDSDEDVVAAYRGKATLFRPFGPAAAPVVEGTWHGKPGMDLD
ncbi:hypothetical protein ACEVHA_027425 [Klebsiella pneumoniae]